MSVSSEIQDNNWSLFGFEKKNPILIYAFSLK